MTTPNKLDEILLNHQILLCHPMLSIQSANDEAKSAILELISECIPEEESYDGPTGLFSPDKYQIDGWNRCRKAILENIERLNGRSS